MKLWIDKNPKKCILLISTLIFISIFGLFFLKSSKQIYICLTSLSFLHGRFDLPFSPLRLPEDLQFHSGKIFTNWGFATPILQLPFQLISRLFDRTIFFPEVFIFYFYYIFCTIYIFNYIKSLIKNIKTSVIFSCFIVAVLTLWLVSYRFEVYEQTAAYYMLGLICFFVSYKKILGRQNMKNYIFHVVFSSLLILTRPLAIIPIVLVNIHLLTKNRRLFLFSILSLVIPISIFALSNYIKMGSFFADGLINTNPGNIHQLLSNRIGDACVFTNFDLFVAKIKIFFHVIFYGNSSTYPCFLTFEDSTSLHKPYLSHFLNLLALFSIIFLIYKHKYVDVLFFLAGLILTFFTYVFFSFYFNYRYIVDFLFFYFLLFFEVFLLLCYKRRYDKIYLNKVNLLLIFSFLLYFVKIIYPQLPGITAVVNTENYSLINFSEKKVDYFPLYRSCGDKKLNGSDLVSWDQTDCKVKGYLNTYLSFIKNERNKYRLNIEGKNLPAILTLIINGKTYNNIDWRHFEFEMNKIRGNNVNVFIYFGDESKDVVIRKIYFN
jgi:hypothetical protein